MVTRCRNSVIFLTFAFVLWTGEARSQSELSALADRILLVTRRAVGGGGANVMDRPGEGTQVRELGESKNAGEVKIIDRVLTEESKVGLGNAKPEDKAKALNDMKRVLALFKKGPLSSLSARVLRRLCVQYSHLIHQNRNVLNGQLVLLLLEGLQVILRIADLLLNIAQGSNQLT